MCQRVHRSVPLVYKNTDPYGGTVNLLVSFCKSGSQPFDTNFEIYGATIGVCVFCQRVHCSAPFVDKNTGPYGGTLNFKLCPRRSSDHPNLQSRIWLKSRPALTCTSESGRFRKLSCWNARQIPLLKVVDFEPLGTLFGPGPPNAELAPFRKRRVTKDVRN